MTTIPASLVSTEQFIRIWQAAQSIDDVRQAFPFAIETDLRLRAKYIRRYRPEMKHLPGLEPNPGAHKPIGKDQLAPTADAIELYTLPPGSILANCTCPTAVNHRGQGGYVVRSDCPLHGDSQWSSSWWALCSQWV